MEVTDELVDIVAPPVFDGGEATWVCLIVGLVGQGKSVHGIGIEVIVHVNAIHVVVCEDVLDNHAGVGAVFLDGGIEDVESVVFEHTFGMTNGGMILCQCCCAFCLGSVGIYPCMAFHLTFMTFCHHPCQGVPSVGWCHTLCACEIA